MRKPYLGGKLVLAAVVYKEGGVENVMRHHGCIPCQDCWHKESLRQQLRSAIGDLHKAPCFWGPVVINFIDAHK